LAIVGGSGSGKTTLLRLANRLIEADTGSITVEGEDVPTRSDPAARRIATSSRAAGCFRT
jgi:osmoprotectant transport system ATP-binding protein